MGARAVPARSRPSMRPRLRSRRDRLRQAAGRARRPARRSSARCGSAAARPARRRQLGARASGARAASGSERCACSLEVGWWPAHHSSPRSRFRPSAPGEGRVVRPPHRPPSLRARLVASYVVGRDRPCDRHRHPQRSARPLAHRPDLQARAPAPREQRARARGRQGDQCGAGAQAARRAGGGDRPRGRANRDADRRGADGGVDPQRLRPDPGRVAHVDGRRRPDLEHLHRDQRVGPEGLAGRARHLDGQAPLPLPRRLDGGLRRARCLAGSTKGSTPKRCAR